MAPVPPRPSRPAPAGWGPAHARRAGATVGLPRPDGGWQLGVGPGAMVVRADDQPGSGPEGATGTAALLGAGLSVPSTRERALRCPVVGTSRLATRLRGCLGGLGAEDDDGEGLLVLVQHHVIPPETALRVVGRPGPALPVVVQARRVVIGPVSGLAGPCLHCLDLRRRDLDQDWPEIAHTWGHPAVQSEPVPMDQAVEDAAAGLTVMVARSVVAGRATPIGVAHEVGPGPPHLVTRHWVRHPACRWHRTV